MAIASCTQRPWWTEERQFVIIILWKEAWSLLLAPRCLVSKFRWLTVPTKLIKWINQRGHASYVTCGLQPCVQKCIGLLQRIPKITCSSMSKRDLRQVKNLRSIFQAQSFSHFVLALSLGVLSFHKTQVNQKEQQPLLLVITLWRINPSKMTFSTT